MVINEIKVSFYNDIEKVGFNDWHEIYCTKNNVWIKGYYHLGRLVYGSNRLPYKKIIKNITHKNYVVQEYLPF